MTSLALWLLAELEGGWPGSLALGVGQLPVIHTPLAVKLNEEEFRFGRTIGRRVRPRSKQHSASSASTSSWYMLLKTGTASSWMRLSAGELQRWHEGFGRVFSMAAVTPTAYGVSPCWAVKCRCVGPG